MAKLRSNYVTRFCINVCAAFLLFSFDATAQIRSSPDKESTHILRIEENTPDPKIKIEPLTGYPDTTSLVTNRAKTLKAYILCLPAVQKEASCSARVFFTDKAAGKTFMISGEDEGTERSRPIDNLKWLDNERLSYERWMGPHFGHRYVVNVKLKKQVAAYAVTDIVR